VSTENEKVQKLIDKAAEHTKKANEAIIDKLKETQLALAQGFFEQAKREKNTYSA
jgi:hypothetical protein